MADVPTTTYVTDRQKAIGRFRTLPWAHLLQAERRAMGGTIQDVWSAWEQSDDEFQVAYEKARDAVAAFTDG